MTALTLENLAREVGLAPLHQWLQVKVVALDQATGSVTVELPFRDEFRRAPDRPEVHGGIISAFADLAGHAVVAAHLGHGVPTIDLRVDYLRMAAGRHLMAIAKPVKIGRTIAVIDIQVLDPEARLAAIGRGAYSTRQG